MHVNQSPNKAVFKIPVDKNSLCLLIWIHVVLLFHSSLFLLLYSFEHSKLFLQQGFPFAVCSLWRALSPYLQMASSLFPRKRFPWQPNVLSHTSPITFYPTLSYFLHSIYKLLMLYYLLTCFSLFLPFQIEYKHHKWRGLSVMVITVSSEIKPDYCKHDMFNKYLLNA